jgi:shikimate kinase
MAGLHEGTVLATGGGMISAESAGTAQSSQAFTVLIPRGLQATVDGLPAEARQELLAELFRMAALAHQERSLLPSAAPYTLRLDLAGCQVSVELDPARSRLTLAGLVRARALA